jgi:hypothetical protein
MLGLGNTLAGGAPSPEWTPAELSGLVAWYRYNTGIDDDTDEAQVTQWTDQSGQGNHATKASETPEYSAAENAVLFLGSTDSMDINSTTGLTLTTFSAYIRLKFKEVGETVGGEFLFTKATGTSGQNWIKVHSTTEMRTKLGNSARKDYTLPVTLAEATKYNIGIERNSSSEVRMFVDGTAASNGSGGESHTIDKDLKQYELDDLCFPADGLYVYEVVITTNALSASERTLLDTWLDSETEG